MPAYYSLHVPSGRSWPTSDPHRWLLARRDGDLLAPARERLLLSPDDPERCLRAVLRRCSLALVQVAGQERLVVRHWGESAPDLRGWAKEHRWNRPGVAVTFVNVKTGHAVVHEAGGDVLIHGEQVSEEFPSGVYEAKYERRHGEEEDDSEAASSSFTNFEWTNCPHGTLTLRVLKAIWVAEQVACPNCDVPLILVAFDWRMGMLSFRSGRVVRVCLHCRRRFVAAVQEPLAWLASVLPPPLRPGHLRLWKPIPINWLGMSLGDARPVQLVGRGG